MPAKKRTIDVYANPFHALDAEGTPQAVVSMPGTRNHIGAQRDLKRSAEEGRAIFAFTGDKVTVPFDNDIVRAVLEGSLIVATESSARMCGLSGFADPKKQLEAEKALATERWRAILADPSASIKDPPAIEEVEAPVRETKSKGGTKVAPGVTLQTEADR